MAPIGTQVRVVNEPFVFGWQDDQLYLQAFDVLEDDPRDWKNAQKKLVSKSLGADIQKELKKRKEEVNWDLVSKIAHQPRGIPEAITGHDQPGLEQLLAGAPRVLNQVPPNASWDGKSDLPVDEATMREMLSDRDPQASNAVGGAAAPASGPAPVS